MRFSSDQELFEQSSKDPSQHQKSTFKRKQKKQTMLSKFLASLDENVMKKLQYYEKLKRPIFQRRNMVPQKLTLYEDILFIMVFKDNQKKVIADSKQIKAICIDLESRTKRKQCTIKERMQKKLCKMSPLQLLDHVANDKDISFNLKKVLTSGAKFDQQKYNRNNGSQNSDHKPISQKDITNPENKTPNKQDDQNYMNIDNSPSKKSYIFEEKEEDNIEQEKSNKIELKSEQSVPKKTQEIDEGEIHIIFKKDSQSDNVFMFNSLLIHKEIMEMKQKEKEFGQKEELMKQLKLQIDVIMHFKKQTTLVPFEVQTLITEAQKIMKILGIGSMKQIQQTQEMPVGQQMKKVSEATADRLHTSEEHQTCVDQLKGSNKVSEFSIEEQKQQMTEQVPISKGVSLKEEKKFTIEYALCEIQDYIKLYKSNPSVFEPLLWASDEDLLIDKLLEDFETNEQLFNLLIRYKGPEMFIERCIFLKKEIHGCEKLIEAIRNSKPLNLNRLNSYLGQVSGLKLKGDNSENNINDAPDDQSLNQMSEMKARMENMIQC